MRSLEDPSYSWQYANYESEQMENAIAERYEEEKEEVRRTLSYLCDILYDKDGIDEKIFTNRLEDVLYIFGMELPEGKINFKKKTEQPLRDWVDFSREYYNKISMV